MDRFNNRNALVTGASRGIGASIAERLAVEGANLVIVARTIDKHDHLAGSLADTTVRCRSYDTKVEAVAGDLSDEQSRAQIIPRALEILDGRIDILVNNAAAAIYQPIVEFPLRRRRIIFEVNVHAPTDLIQAVLPQMHERGEGWIVNISSAGAAIAARKMINTDVSDETPRNSDIGIYGASKAALNRLTVAFAQSLAGTGIRINALAPRWSSSFSEGMRSLMGASVQEDLVESMEAMVEGVIALCDCEEYWTGGVHCSLDVLDVLGIQVMSLDGRNPYPGGFRIFRGE